jgi:NAD(P)-dependent dehydrogenase (short-subunit alcohol dehydrogenase family)
MHHPLEMDRSSSPPPNSTQELEGKRVLVAGASSGIGQACALLCAERGARILAVARRGNLLEELARSDSQRIAVLQADLSQEAQRRTVAEHTSEILGGLDALVYTAGWAPLCDVAEYDAETWRHLIAEELVCHLAPVDPTQPGGSLAQREPGEALRSSSHSAEGPS